ncbi:MAG: hypothetical protein U0V73_07700 [Acidimicrobiia bacterium]
MHASADVRRVYGDGVTKAPLVCFLAGAAIAVALGAHGLLLLVVCAGVAPSGGYGWLRLRRTLSGRRGVREIERYLGAPKRARRASR